MLAEAGFHLTAFDPVPTDLHLRVLASDDEEQPVTPHAQVTGPVPALSIRIVDECGRGVLGIPVVPPCQSDPSDHEFTHTLVGPVMTVRIDHAIFLPGQWFPIGN